MSSRDQLNLRLTPAELADIRLRAKRAGLTASEYLRRAAAGCMACDDTGVTCANPATWEGVLSTEWAEYKREGRPYPETVWGRLCRWHSEGLSE